VLDAPLVDPELHPLLGEPAQGMEIAEDDGRIEKPLRVGAPLGPCLGEPRIDLAKYL
jgi:hypothetical protein